MSCPAYLNIDTVKIQNQNPKVTLVKRNNQTHNTNKTVKRFVDPNLNLSLQPF